MSGRVTLDEAMKLLDILDDMATLTGNERAHIIVEWIKEDLYNYNDLKENYN